MPPSTAPATTDPRRPNQLLYTVVRDRILADLATSGLTAGERYYTEAALADRYNVSRNTVRRAMAELESRGYLQRQRGMGSIVRQLPGAPATEPNQPRHTASQANRLITILPQWDDSTEGFYAARILRELTGIESMRAWSIEVRHPTDPLDLTPSGTLACFAIDPNHATVQRLASLAAKGVRVVTTTPAYPMPFAINFCDDTRGAAYEAVQHFHHMAHRSIGILVHDLNHNDYRMALNGFLDAHRDLDLPIHPHAIVRFSHDPNTPPPPPPRVDQITAWIATFGGSVNILAKACLECGLSIPDDISIIGLDDPSDHHTGALGKRLTVIRADPAATARALCACLAHWNDDLRGQIVTLPMEHIPRESVAPARRTPSAKPAASE